MTKHTENTDPKGKQGDMEAAFIASNKVLKQLADSLNLPPNNEICKLIHANDKLIATLK